MQLFKGTLTIPAGGTTVRTVLVPDNQPIHANFSVNPTSFLATFTAWPNGDNYDCSPGAASDSEEILLTGFTVTGTPGDTVSVALYWPEKVTAAPVTSVSISGTPNFNLQKIGGTTQTGVDSALFAKDTSVVALNAQAYANGGTTPGPGSIVVLLKGDVGGDTPTLSIGGGGAAPLDGGALASGVVRRYTIPVVGAQTYTFAACTYVNGEFVPTGSS